MTSPALTSRLAVEFDAFLFAPIGEDSNGLTLRVVSLLARLDLDPWAEASTLARLPPQAAVEKLALILSAVPVLSLKPPLLISVATDLVALLPDQMPHAGRALGMPQSGVGDQSHLALRTILFAIWLITLLGLQALAARPDAPAGGSTPQVLLPSISSAQAPRAPPAQ